MSEHTKGEWTVPLRTRRDGDNRCWVMQGKASICRCFGKPKTAEANARLIAAAPKLLFAAKIGRAYIDSVITGVPMPIMDLEDNKQIVEVAISEAESK